MRKVEIEIHDDAAAVLEEMLLDQKRKLEIALENCRKKVRDYEDVVELEMDFQSGLNAKLSTTELMLKALYNSSSIK